MPSALAVIYHLPGDLEAHIDRFVDHYNHHRYHESLQNLTPADVYFGRGQTILRSASSSPYASSPPSYLTSIAAQHEHWRSAQSAAVIASLWIISAVVVAAWLFRKF